MPNGNETPRIKYPTPKEFRTLPSFFSVEEERELTDVTSQLEGARGRMETWDWEKRPTWEKGLREFAAWFHPETMGRALPRPGFEYGITPEETEAITYQLALRQQELMDRKTISEDTQEITSQLQALAEEGIPVTSVAELETIFPHISREPWTAEDREWLIDYMAAVAEGREGVVPTAPPVTAEDVETTYRKLGLNPDFIASSVAWSTDIGEVTNALRAMHRPPELADVAPEHREKIISELKSWGFWSGELSFEENFSKRVKFEDMAENADEEEIYEYIEENYPPEQYPDLYPTGIRKVVLDILGALGVALESFEYIDLPTKMAERTGQIQRDLREGEEVSTAENLFQSMYSGEWYRAYGREPVSWWERNFPMFWSLFHTTDARDPMNYVGVYADEPRPGEFTITPEMKEAYYAATSAKMDIALSGTAPSMWYFLLLGLVLPSAPAVKFGGWLAPKAGLTIGTRTGLAKGVIPAIRMSLQRGGVTGAKSAASRLGIAATIDALAPIRTLELVPKWTIGRGWNAAMARRTLSRASLTLEEDFAKLGVSARESKSMFNAFLKAQGALEDVIASMAKGTSPKVLFRAALKYTYNDFVHNLKIDPAKARELTEAWGKGVMGIFETEIKANASGQSLRNLATKGATLGAETERANLLKLIDKIITEKMLPEDITAEFIEKWMIENNKSLPIIPVETKIPLDKRNPIARVLGQATGSDRIIERLSLSQRWATILSAEAPERFNIGVITKKVNAFRELLAEKDWAIISAQNPAKSTRWARLTPAQRDSENISLHNKLGQELRKAGYDIEETTWVGAMGTAEEKGYLIKNIPEEDAIALMRKFEQEAIITPNGLLNNISATKVTLNPIRWGNTKYNSPGNKFYTHLTWEGEPIKFSFDITGKEIDYVVGKATSLSPTQLIAQLKASNPRLDFVLKSRGKSWSFSSILQQRTGSQNILYGERGIAETLRSLGIPVTSENEKLFIQAVLLHEQGHGVASGALGHGVRVETLAWQWAIDHAPEYGIHSKDMMRLCRKLIPTLHASFGENSIIKNLEAAKVFPTGEARVGVTGFIQPEFERELPEGYSLIARAPKLEDEWRIMEDKLLDFPKVKEYLTPLPDPNVIAETAPKSLHVGKLPRIRDIPDFARIIEDQCGLPFYKRYRRITTLFRGTDKEWTDFFNKRIAQNPRFVKILKSKDSMRRLSESIIARREGGLAPAGMTMDEKALQAEMEEIYRTFEPIVRYQRFIEAYSRTPGDPDAIARTFRLRGKPIEPSLKADIDMACGVLEAEGEDALYNFLSTKSWGVVGTAYDPIMTAYPRSLFDRYSRELPQIGYRHLQMRYATPTPQEGNPVQRLMSYGRRTLIRYRTSTDIRALDADITRSWDLFDNPEEIERIFRSSLTEWERIPESLNIAQRAILRLQSQVYATVFGTLPYLPFRNIFQPISFAFDRIGLFKRGFKPCPAWKRFYYDNLVCQMSGIRQYMLEEELGTKWNPFTIINRISQKLNLYGHSDNVPRRITFNAASDKAEEAGKKFLASAKTKEDIDILIRNSEARRLVKGNRDYYIKLLLMDEVDLGVPNMRRLTGLEASSGYLGEQIADLVHFRYIRGLRPELEHGFYGKSVFNLFVFTRSYWTRQVTQLNLVRDVTLPMRDRIAALRGVVAAVFWGIVVSEFISKTTGSKRKAYNPLDIMSWQFGGLAIGFPIEVTAAMYDLLLAVSGDMSAQSRVTKALPRMASTLLPWYTVVLGSMESATDKSYMDRDFLRTIVHKLNSEFTVEQRDAAERDLVERMQHIMFRTETVEEHSVDSAREEIWEKEQLIGQRDEEGALYTLDRFATDVNRIMKAQGIPDDIITWDYNFSPLVIFYLDCKDEWTEYDALGTAAEKREYRESHSFVDATMYMFKHNGITEVRSSQAQADVVTICNYMNIPRTALPTLAEAEEEYWRSKLEEELLPKPLVI